MEEYVTRTLAHMAESQQHLERILRAKRDVVVHLSDLITVLPDVDVSFCNKDDMYEQCSDLTTNLVSYLNSIGEFEEALAENLSIVVKEYNLANESTE